jgi:hypothetical protein
MKEKEILFVTYMDETLEEGLSYAIYLASMLGQKLRILLINKRNIGEMFEDLMTAITFAEANEHETARQVMSGSARSGKDTAAVHAYLQERCNGAGIRASIHTGLMDTVSAVKDLLKEKSRIDMVLLSPNVTRSGNILSRLMKASSRPVVTMAQQRRQVSH